MPDENRHTTAIFNQLYSGGVYKDVNEIKDGRISFPEKPLSF